MNDTEKLLASYDCGNAGGWLSEDLECAIDSEPWCQRHQLLALKAWKDHWYPVIYPDQEEVTLDNRN
jgi:hypothetical protein